MPGKPAQRPVPGLTRAPAVQSKVSFKAHTIATGLNHPWGLAFLPDGRLIVAERYGGLRVVSQQAHVSPELGGVPKALMEDQGGLFDIVLAPDFVRSRVLLFSYFEPRGAGAGLAVARAAFGGGREGRASGGCAGDLSRPARHRSREEYRRAHDRRT